MVLHWYYIDKYTLSTQMSLSTILVDIDTNTIDEKRKKRYRTKNKPKYFERIRAK